MSKALLIAAVALMTYSAGTCLVSTLTTANSKISSVLNVAGSQGQKNWIPAK